MSVYQPSFVTFPDAELAVCLHLRQRLAALGEEGFTVANRKPSEDRPKTVLVRRDGGKPDGLYDFARIAIRVFDDEETVASRLAYRVRSILLAAPGSPPFVDAECFTGPVGIPDESQPEKYLTFDLQLAAEAP